MKNLKFFIVYSTRFIILKWKWWKVVHRKLRKLELKTDTLLFVINWKKGFPSVVFILTETKEFFISMILLGHVTLLVNHTFGEKFVKWLSNGCRNSIAIRQPWIKKFANFFFRQPFDNLKILSPPIRKPSERLIKTFIK